MTRITILGQPQGVEVEKKKIEFVKQIMGDFDRMNPERTPGSFSNIMLLRKGYGETYLDAMYAWDEPGNGCLFLGHWNDGVV